MTAKEYLKQFGDLDRELRLKYEQLQKLYDIRMPAPTPGKAQASGDLDAAFAALERQYTADINRLLQLKHDLQLMIDSLDNSNQRIVLTEKYINLRQPDDIAIEIPCDVRTVYRWLNEAITALQSKHPDRFDTCQ